MNNMDLVHKVEQTIKAYQLLKQGDTVITAVSGGPDSMALLHILKQLAQSWKLQVIATHVNHRFRAVEAAREADAVQKLAEALKLQYEAVEIDVPAYAQKEKLNTQVAAREKRYGFLFHVAEKYNAHTIALGHHADDQAETLLMRILRGTGPSGLTGIPMQRIERGVQLIRPLLQLYKSELTAYCKQHDITYCEDGSNTERKYVRNQIRLDAIPYLKQWNEQMPQALNRLAGMMQDENEYMLEQTKQLYQQIISKQDDKYVFSRTQFVLIPTALQRRLITLILSYLSPKRETADYHKIERIRTAVLDQVPPTLTLDIGDGIKLFREYEQISLGVEESLEVTSFAYELDNFPANIQVGTGTIMLDIIDPSAYYAARKSSSIQEAFVDLDQLQLPICVRNRQPGDRMKVAGLNGTKKVKDIFIDAKIPPSIRESVPLVVDGNQHIVWIAGIRYSTHAVVTKQSERILHMKYIHFI